MKTFSEVEKTIARNIDKEYKWIARDHDGTLYVSKKKPKKTDNIWDVGSKYSPLSVFNYLFPAIKWEDKEPVKISDIYNPQVLNYVEREYLKAVLKPFHGVVEYVKKIKNDDKEYLFIPFSGNGALAFPDFFVGEMYTGMELDKKYSLDELGITYKEEDE